MADARSGYQKSDAQRAATEREKAAAKDPTPKGPGCRKADAGHREWLLPKVATPREAAAQRAATERKKAAAWDPTPRGPGCRKDDARRREWLPPKKGQRRERPPPKGLHT